MKPIATSHRRFAIASPVLLAVLVALGCGSSGSEQSSVREREKSAPTNYGVMRDKVLLGLAREFRTSADAAPRRYGICVRLGLRRALTPQQLRRLAAIYRQPDGQRLAVRALDALAAPVGARCGGARYLPALGAAAAALGGGYPLSRLGIAARRLGLTYGPYLGVACRKAGSTACDRVDLDLVLRRDARAVTAWVGGRALVMRTPGLHTGRAGRDWVGYLDRVGLRRPDSPFHVPVRASSPVAWAGSPSLYFRVRMEITYPDETTATGTLPHVFLSPGWG